MCLWWYVCASVSECVTNLKLPRISLWHWIPLAILCLYCVCTLQGLLILECFFLQLQSLSDLTCSKGLSHFKLLDLLCHFFYSLPSPTLKQYGDFHDSAGVGRTTPPLTMSCTSLILPCQCELSQ